MIKINTDDILSNNEYGKIRKQKKDQSLYFIRKEDV
jgi:hypothetical protein